jgi:antitoxin component YwqK of YwqJK toxin-antitoxin module
MNKSALHFAFNEAWILTGFSVQEKMSNAELMAHNVVSIADVKTYEELYPDGRLRLRFSGGIGDDGRFLLHGTEKWFFPDGSMQRLANYDKGRKAGTETYMAKDGSKVWTWEHLDDGSSLWTQFWPDGSKRAESTWRGFSCEGLSTVWDRDGGVISRNEFINGKNTAQMSIAGKLIIDSTQSMTAAANSILNGPGATITVNGGSFTVNGRFNLGTGSDGFIILNNGAFTVKGLFTFPDGEGGVHRITLNGGIMHAESIEQKHERDAIIYVGGGLLHLDDISDSDGDPHEWKKAGDLRPAEGFDDVVIEDCGDYTQVRAVKDPPEIQTIN